MVIGQTNKVKNSFKSFEVVKTEGRIDVKWTINEEEIAGYFEFDRSFDGRCLKTIMVILGPEPSNMVENKNSVFEKFSTKKKLYYR